MSEILNKAKDLKKAGIGELLKNLYKEITSGNGEKTLKALGALVMAAISGKLFNLKGKVEKTRAAATQHAASTVTGKKEDSTKKTPEPAVILAKKDIEEFREGKLFASFSETFPHAEIEPKLVQLRTGIMKDRHGAPGWPRNSTDDWDFAKAGNTEKKMAQGIYSIEGTLPPDGYTRHVKNKVPKVTQVKLTQIAIALNKDPRMPLFKGIAMTVDGIEVMMVKEIHMHKRGTGTTYLCQPHTGVSYIVKK